MPRERSAARSALFGLLVLGMVYGVVEGVSRVTYSWVSSESYSSAQISARRRELISTQPEPDAATQAALVQKYVPHPYLGFVMNPEHFSEGVDWWIYADDDPFESPPNALNVVVVGGSVAFNLRESGGRLLASLQAIPAYRERSLRLITLAGLGHKQPQQLMAAAYFLSLGGRIDLMINLDGFNEIGSEIDRNLRQGVHPSYPSFWSQVTRDLGSAGELQGLGELVFLRRARSSLAGAFEATHWSALANFAWFMLDRRIETAIHERIGRDLEVDAGPFYSRGPAFAGSPNEARLRSVRLWRDGSLALHRLAEGVGFDYYHFLQPNQYVANSKRKWTRVEVEKYTVRDSFRVIVGFWYPKLQAAGRELAERGVNFSDLTGIYREVESTVYRDSCCHLGDAGRDLLVDSISLVIAEHLANDPNSPGRLD